jgi:hypothetical protein
MTKSIDDVMAEQEKDTLFIQFNQNDCPEELKQKHFSWFNENQIVYESASYRGLANTGDLCYAVYFTDLNDSRIPKYTDQFEDSNGISLCPNNYQMIRIEYKEWLSTGGEIFLSQRTTP